MPQSESEEAALQNNCLAEILGKTTFGNPWMMISDCAFLSVCTHSRIPLFGSVV